MADGRAECRAAARDHGARRQGGADRPESRTGELSGFEKKFPWQLSGGMQQRVSIARALAFDPSCCLWTSPSARWTRSCETTEPAIARMWDRTKKTVVFVTHSIPEAVFLSTKIVVMSPRPGRIIDVIETNFPRRRSSTSARRRSSWLSPTACARG